ncbi:MAG: class I SAM-dependent methyltransferase [Bacteroidota bacterium]|nr:class I SAM-dependent methyltransferase [Bacteroidota bacterium]
MDILNSAEQVDFFNSFAKKYHKADRFTFKLRKKITRRIISGMTIPPDGVICDLMCGDGKNISFLTEKLKYKKLYAVDFSANMITQAKKNNFSPDIIFLNENSLGLSIGDSTVDAVTCTFGIKTLKNREQELLMLEIKRILKPGGRFVIAEISKPQKHFPSLLFYLFFNGIMEMAGMLFNYKFIRRKFLMKSILAFGSAKYISDYSLTLFPTVQLFSWYGGMITGINGQKEIISRQQPPAETLQDQNRTFEQSCC